MAQTIKDAFTNGLDTAKDVAQSVTDPKKRQLDHYTSEATPNDALTTYFGAKQSNTDSSLKAGERGPTLLEDAHFREKISTFDHERIPERVVHARGAAAHGHFKLHTPIPEFSKAGILNDTSRTTPMFTRFSTVAGSRGSADSVRDVRGFSTRFYSAEGNWDIVGNNIPVFFIQDAIKFPDVIHALKPEPDKEMPQAQSAHDNAWDFLGLQPETQHMQMWHLSDRTIPRSFRMMNGHGVNTFLLVNDQEEATFCKFHWESKLGVHGLVWDEALKVAGQDPDFHRRDMYDAIESGSYPQWELGIQTMKESEVDALDFDPLDATKIWPEEQFPIKFIGTMTLDRNVSDYFAETEQVAFCTSHIVPGIDHSNDPLLQGRNFSYFDTQISRLGINFGDLPINKPVCPVFNNLRDGQGSHKIHKGKVNYYPNRFDAPHPVPVSQGGASTFPTKVSGVKTRERGPKFSEHILQAQLFYNSMTPVEKKHIQSAASFELGKVEDEEIQQKMIEQFNRVDHGLAQAVADELSLECPAALNNNDGRTSKFLSMVDGSRQVYSAATRKIAIFVADGFDVKVYGAIYAAVKAAGALPFTVGSKQKVKGSDGQLHKGEFTLETCRSTFFDGLVFIGGNEGYEQSLKKTGRYIHAFQESFMHQKAILVQGQACEWAVNTCLPRELDAASLTSQADVVNDKGVIFCSSTPSAAALEKYIDLIAHHRVWERDVSSIAA